VLFVSFDTWQLTWPRLRAVINSTKIQNKKKPPILLRGHSMSYILAPINTSCMTLQFILAVNSNFRSTFSRLKDIAGFVRPEPLFHIPTPVLAKIRGVPFGVDLLCWSVPRTKTLR